MLVNTLVGVRAVPKSLHDLMGSLRATRWQTLRHLELPAALPILLSKKPDVLAITGDHSTPCAMKSHSWHPQPVLLQSAYSGSDKLDRFTETGAPPAAMFAAM